jgi:hypothetical protein
VYSKSAPCPSGAVAGLNSQTISMPSTFNWSMNIGVGNGGLLGMNRTDGITDGINTIQGVRMYDSTANQWTTPDDYAGDIDDPASQKSYLWNGGNPVSNADPSGYCSTSTAGGAWVHFGGPPCINDSFSELGDGFANMLYANQNVIIGEVPGFGHGRGGGAPPAKPQAKQRPSCDENSAQMHVPGRNWADQYAAGIQHGYDYNAAKSLMTGYGRFNYQAGGHTELRPQSNFGVGVYAQAAGWAPGVMEYEIQKVGGEDGLSARQILQDIGWAEAGRLYALEHCDY